MVMIISAIITLLSVTEATTASCTENVSNFTLKLRDEITNTLNQVVSTSDIQELQCAEVDSK